MSCLVLSDMGSFMVLCISMAAQGTTNDEVDKMLAPELSTALASALVQPVTENLRAELSETLACGGRSHRKVSCGASVFDA